MKAWIGRFIRREPLPPPPLRGAPASPRVKHYPAASGYAYEYAYLGYRDESGCRRHFFRVSPDRKKWSEIEVQVDGQAVQAWELDNNRELSAAERYAVAKLALFAAFDEGESPEALRAQVQVSAARIAMLLASIDI
jgi:hypothetical protein